MEQTDEASPTNGDDEPGDHQKGDYEPVLAGLKLGQRFYSELPADSEDDRRSRQVKGAAYSNASPATASQPKLVGWSKDLAGELGLADMDLTHHDVADVFSGQRLLHGSKPYAMAYAGHQFGNWAGQLGDGRAIALGELTATDGSQQTIQLKGAGPTPYSRRADGFAVLRSSIREFLASEAMHHLGVPTSRALSLTLTGDQVMRDMMYDGNPALEPGAIVCRSAPSFIRFGSFELFASRGEIDQLKQLADFTIRHFFSHLSGADQPTNTTYIEWFDEICRSTAHLMVEWLRVGFVHGVVNTDNMSVHGITIDYGPYGWLDNFDPNWTPNTTDAAKRRYRYGNQAAVAQWNLLQLGNALVVLIDDAEPLEKSINGYADKFIVEHRNMMFRKLGLMGEARNDQRVEEDQQLVDGLLKLLCATETDMTIFYRRLAELTAGSQNPIEVVSDAYYDPASVTGHVEKQTLDWFGRYQERLATPAPGPVGQRSRAETMNATNPVYVLRNYMAQEAIELATEGDFSRVERLVEVLSQPYTEQPGAEQFATKCPDWARDQPGCSQLSCSS